jgi:hypothetical protein
MKTQIFDETYSPTLHKNGTVTYWSVYQRQWIRKARHINDEELTAQGADRCRIIRHLGMKTQENWTPAQHVIDAGWALEHVEATAKQGVADIDAESLTEEQQAALLDYCRDRTNARSP